MHRWTIMVGAMALGLAASAAAAQTTDQAASGQVSEAVVQPGLSPFSPNLTPDLVDPLFEPAKGQTLGMTTGSLSSPHVQIFNYRGVETTSRAAQNDSVSQQLKYGLTRDMTVSVTESYQYNSAATTADAKGTVVDTTTQGFGDLTLAANYRLARESLSFPVDVDLGAAFQPNLIHLPGAGAGRQSESVSLGIGRSMQALSVQAVGTVRRLGAVDATSGHPNQQSSTWTYAVALNGLLRLRPALSASASVNYVQEDDRHLANAVTGVAWTAVEPNPLSFSAGLNWQITPRRFVLSLLYVEQVASRVSNLYANIAINTVTRTSPYGSVELRLRYLIR